MQVNGFRTTKTTVKHANTTVVSKNFLGYVRDQLTNRLKKNDCLTHKSPGIFPTKNWNSPIQNTALSSCISCCFTSADIIVNNFLEPPHHFLEKYFCQIFLF